MNMKMKEECRQYLMMGQYDNVKLIVQQAVKENADDYEAWGIMGDLQSNPNYSGYNLEVAKGSYIMAASKSEEHKAYFIKKANAITVAENQKTKDVMKDFVGAWADGMIKAFIRVFIIIGIIVVIMLIGK